jgi:signal transduction histidine kinase
MRSEAALHERTALNLAALGEMTVGIAHDFRNVLAVIDSSLKLAASAKHPEQMHAFVSAAREGISRGTQLTAQLVGFATQHGGEAAAEDVTELLRNFGRLLKYGAGPGIQVVCELADAVPKCLVDPAQFHAAILNLVINARDAMPHGGEINITTVRWTAEPAISHSSGSRSFVRVRVKDQGEGMPDDVARQIFQPFFTTKGKNGTGLGLPQVCAFMRSIGGHVAVASERRIGTSFDLFFPATEADGVHEVRIN